MIEQIYATKQDAFDAGKIVGRLDLDDHAKKRIADLETFVGDLLDSGLFFGTAIELPGEDGLEIERRAKLLLGRSDEPS